jgi:ribose 5-phosphate isomerase A
MPDQNTLKQRAGAYAAQLVTDGIIVGLGSGSTSAAFVDALGKRWQKKELAGIRCVTTSHVISNHASSYGLPIVERSLAKHINLTIDGADEVTLSANALIKGGGAAAKSEKITATMSDRLVIIVDQTKVSPCLGDTWPIPIDVSPHYIETIDDDFRVVQSIINSLNDTVGHDIVVELSKKNSLPRLTDNGDYLVYAYFGSIQHPATLNARLDALVEDNVITNHGLFVDLASDLIIAYPDVIKHFSWRNKAWVEQLLTPSISS